MSANDKIICKNSENLKVNQTIQSLHEINLSLPFLLNFIGHSTLALNLIRTHYCRLIYPEKGGKVPSFLIRSTCGGEGLKGGSPCPPMSFQSLASQYECSPCFISKFPLLGGEKGRNIEAST